MTITKTVIGVDVGSGSVRAGIFDLNGSLLSHATEKITTTRRSGSRVEQSSQEIWQAVCSCIRNALTLADVCAQSVAGIGFDVTHCIGNFAIALVLFVPLRRLLQTLYQKMGYSLP